MHYISRGRRPPKTSHFNGVFDENLRFIGSKWQFFQLMLFAFAVVAFGYLVMLALWVVAG